MNDLAKTIKTIWIIGLSASGKTTLARLLVKKLQEGGHPSVIIDGSEARDLFENKLGFDPESRRRQTLRIKNLALWAIGQKIIPVVALIHPFEDDRARCRAELEGYCEVFLDCDFDECVKRDDKGVYAPALAGKTRYVVGMDIPYEDPVNADVRLASGRYASEELLEQLWTIVRDRLDDNRLPVSGKS